LPLSFCWAWLRWWVEGEIHASIQKTGLTAQTISIAACQSPGDLSRTSMNRPSFRRQPMPARPTSRRCKQSPCKRQVSLRKHSHCAETQVQTRHCLKALLHRRLLVIFCFRQGRISRGRLVSQIKQWHCPPGRRPGNWLCLFLDSLWPARLPGWPGLILSQARRRQPSGRYNSLCCPNRRRLVSCPL